KTLIPDIAAVVKQLPSTVSDLAVGGSGRYLILYLPRLKKLAVFDANEARITQYVTLDEDNVKFAAGMNHLLVVLPGSKVIQRWSLATFERELATPLPVQGKVSAVCMGSASNGPLLLATNENY